MSLSHKESKPDFVNDEGVKWWKQDTLTRYAKEQLTDDTTAWRTKKPNGEETFVLLENGKIIEEEHHTMEGMAYKIDAQRLIRREHGE